ncbi:hypothetical protein E2F46_08735 [Luteimonas aestuarii]|uniref:Uncharacterized protein n=1 Tax=Luteimonas aestuarii TaxID=453837 RepID=A0A4R5TTM0_9GAMM|nr:hypothetical protein [Luteimonas aestuarii]TDK24360.1 hypothetical protein E2F46_08735 [Luteimonas aestuarii]
MPGKHDNRWRSRALIALLCVCACATSAAHAQRACARTVLESLGWQFTVDQAIDAPRIEAGLPCERADLDAARGAGDLRAVLPAGFGGAAAEAWYRALLDHPATACAYAFELGTATRRAVDRLVANDGYRFSALQLGWIGFGAGGSARAGWRPIASFGRGYVPRDGNWRAIEGFYTGHVRAECGVGRQVAQYAAQAELYGSEGFDAAFAADEIVIGRWHVLNTGNGILQGASAGDYVRDGEARKASSLGRQAFVGVPGYIEHVFARHALDDINNQAQNFVVYDVDAAAASSLREAGGFAAYNDKARLLWQLSQAFPQARPHAFFERLLVARDERLHEALDAGQRDLLARMAAVLDDPFFSGFRIYVHRQGVQSVGYHFVRMLDRNPRTPFHIAFALHNVHTTLRQRYMAHRLAGCDGATPPATVRMRGQDDVRVAVIRPGRPSPSIPTNKEQAHVASLDTGRQPAPGGRVADGDGRVQPPGS